MMLIDLFGQSVLVLLISSASAQSGSFNATASSTDTEPEPNVVQSLLFLAIPVMIALSIVTFAARKAYLACSPQLTAKENTPKPREMDEFCTSIDTTDSIDDITFADAKADSGSWNPFKKYSNVAKTEAVTPEDGDEELGMKSKPIALGTVSKQEVQRSPHPHGFARVSIYANEGIMPVQSLGTTVRV